ncbi:hypothetical protein CC86DRAFT_414259 [Ophiobolus disseminans]|uniref:JmjC domain-containing protein n=1 Tax=Ophiobolus disseminans TaxID=1469910 RepID=A0A6A6ZAJ2_9PLEO|nr:hypothetical protein CC86DRAFT_414259 [Ophiobolus disseminans]
MTGAGSRVLTKKSRLWARSQRAHARAKRGRKAGRERMRRRMREHRAARKLQEQIEMLRAKEGVLRGAGGEGGDEVVGWIVVGQAAFILLWRSRPMKVAEEIIVRQRRRSDDVRLEPIAYSQALQALTQYCDLDREIMTSLVGREAAEPFLYLIEKWPAVLDVPHDTTQTTGLDGTSPIHWRTGNHIQNRSQVLARAIHDMGGKSHATFSSGHIVPLAAPDEQNTSADAKILSLMINPDPESLDLMYAANIPGTGKPPFHFPGVLRNLRHFEEAEITKYSSNITPQGTVVDLHQDHMDVFSICTDWKLWVFFRPTDHNLALLRGSGKSTKNLFRHFKELRDGLWGIAEPWQSFYIPTGYLHATYSLKGSVTIGTMWSSAEALEAAGDALLAELRPNSQVTVTQRSDLIYFLRSLIQTFHILQYERCKAAMQRICWRRVDIAGREGPLFGPSWALQKGPQGELNKCFEALEGGIAASKLPPSFWTCEATDCGILLNHVWSVDDVAQIKRKSGYKK